MTNPRRHEVGSPPTLRRHVARVVALTLGVSVVGPLLGVSLPLAEAVVPAAVTTNNPPSTGLNIITFPQRDFISATGYHAGDTVQVSVVHPSGVSYTTGDVTPQADPRAAVGAAFAGIVDVNHPGGACWPTTTPDIRPGDAIRITITANAAEPARVGVADESIVRNVTAGRPVQTALDTVQIHGTAVQADGVTPVPVGQIEQRLVANRDAFLLNGRRTLRATSAAGSDGSLAYDTVNNPTGLNWTATYSGLLPADVTRALSAESRVLWLPPVVAPAVPTESTIYENGAGIVAGPAGPACTAPAEKLPVAPGGDVTPPTDPTAVNATVTSGNTVTLGWTASTDDVGVVNYGVYRDGVPIATVQNPDATAPAPTTFVDANVPPGTYVYSVDAGDAAGNRSGQAAAPPVTATRAVATLPAGTPVNEPPVAPIQIISFPSRDFISSSGYLPTDTVDVQLLRNEGGSLVLVGTATQIPQPDPRAAVTDPFAGLVEVNHPGGACWIGTTPDMRTGDIVREIAYNADGSMRVVNQTTTSNVVAKKPVLVKAASGTAADGVVEVHGYAADVNGQPIPAGQVESRLIANRDLFDFNNRRVIRAGGAGKDGTFTYDTVDNPTGVNWTATYSGLDADDVARALGGTSPTTGRVFTGAESRALWLSVTPAAAPEITIYENDGATGVRNGPAAPVCSSPGEPLDTAPPTFSTPSAGLTAAVVAGPTPTTNDVQLNWVAASDDVAVNGYRVYRDGQPLRNTGATTTSYLDKNVVGQHTYAVDATDAASPGVGGNAQGTPYGNRSAASDPVTVTVPDVSPPSVPTNLVATVAPNGADVTLTWSASTDNRAVTGYGVYRRVQGTTGWAKQGSDVTTGTTFLDTVPVGTYEYTVDAVDAAGNRSLQADPPALVNAVGDTIRPSDVAGVSVTNDPDIHGKNVLVRWAAATDNIGVTSYGVYRNGIKIANVSAPSLSFLDLGLPAGTYRYAVDAADSAGNRSAAPSSPVTAIVANDPPLAPHSLIAFPGRDFISAVNYTPNTAYTFTLIHPNGTTYGSTNVVSDAAGAVEVNHPGGGCWTTTTPDMKPGDVIRITNAVTEVAEQTTVANVMAERPVVTSVDPATGGGTVQVHGTAQDAAGRPLPAAQVENRLVSNKDAFDLNGRRTVRAGGAGSDGTFAYDGSGSIRWTATYTFQTPNDLARAVGGRSTSGTTFVGAESRGIWLGRTPAALTESTINENGAGVIGGPAAVVGCTSGAAEVPAAGAALSAAPTLPATAVGSTSAAQPVTITNNGTASLNIAKAYLAGLNPADFVITANNATGATVAPGSSVTVSVAFRPSAAGFRQANLSFTDNAANTTDQTVQLTASTPASASQTATAPVPSLAAGNVLGLRTPVADSVLPVGLKWTGSGPSYQLQMATGPSTGSLGGFNDVALDNAGATSTTVNLRMGSFTAPVAYRFQVRACNGTVCGGYAQGAAFTLLPVDDTITNAVTYKGTWTALSGQVGFYNDTTHWTTAGSLGQTVQFVVVGNAAWVGVRGPDRGLAQVQIDGATPQVVDLYSPTVQNATVVWAKDALSAGTHTVTIQALGKKSVLNPAPCNTGNQCARVDFDMMAYLK